MVEGASRKASSSPSMETSRTLPLDFIPLFSRAATGANWIVRDPLLVAAESGKGLLAGVEQLRGWPPRRQGRSLGQSVVVDLLLMRPHSSKAADSNAGVQNGKKLEKHSKLCGSFRVSKECLCRNLYRFGRDSRQDLPILSLVAALGPPRRLRYMPRASIVMVEIWGE
jgi:hypothetical protein